MARFATISEIEICRLKSIITEYYFREILQRDFEERFYRETLQRETLQRLYKLYREKFYEERLYKLYKESQTVNCGT